MFKWLIFLVLLCSCSIQKRADKKLLWLKDKGFIKADTIIYHDTLLGFRVDTMVYFDTTHTQDTLIVVKDGIEVKTLIRWKERLVTQEITKKDTIFKREHFTVKEIKTVEKIPWWVYLVFCLGGVAILGLVFKRSGG